MDDLISIFIDEQYTEEMKILLAKSFAVFDAFDVNLPYTELTDIVMRHGEEETSNLTILFTESVKKSLFDIAKSHGIVLTQDSTIRTALEICSGICILQRLEDYESLARKLEGTKSDEEIICEIFEKVSNLTFIELMDCIEVLEDKFVSSLKDFIRAKEEETDEHREDILRFKMDVLKAFSGKFGDDSIGLKMIRTGTNPGFEFRSYFNLVRDYITRLTDKTDIAKNILSLILMSSDGMSNPITFFRQIAPEIYTDVNLINDIEKELLKISSELESYRRAFEGKTNE